MDTRALTHNNAHKAKTPRQFWLAGMPHAFEPGRHFATLGGWTRVATLGCGASICNPFTHARHNFLSCASSPKPKTFVPKTFVVHHFLYGVEAWNYTVPHMARLEVAHNTCLRCLKGVKRVEKRTLSSTSRRGLVLVPSSSWL